MRRFSNLLVDLDGTLTDPFEGIAGSICHAMSCMGRERPSDQALRDSIGPPLRQSFGKLLGTLDAARIEEAMLLYRERYSVTGLLENQVYPGAADLLAHLTAAGFRLFIATAKPAVFARRIVDHFDLAKYFSGVYGAELDGRLENKRDLLRFLLDAEALSASETAMIGDRSHDMLAAKAHQLGAVGVTWGYGSRSELQHAGADVLCDHPKEIFHFVTESL